MGRVFQVFRAPGPEDEALPLPASPWHVAREARIPQHHWEALVGLARSTADAEVLERAAAVEGDDAAAFVGAYGALDLALGWLLERLEDPATGEPADGSIPDPMPHHELARMVAAVRAVLSEAVGRGEPFESWAD